MSLGTIPRKGESMSSLKAAIVGLGGIAHGKHLPALVKIPGLELVGFCDLVLERAQEAAKKYGQPGAKVTTDYRQVVSMDVDIVYVLTTNNAHAEISIAALQAGKNVLCEKPMAVSSAEAKAMVDAAKRSGKILAIGYQNRFRPDSRYLKALCQEGEFGDIYFAKALAVRRRAVPTWGSFLSEEKQGGGPLIDIGTHALDLTLWMMDNYRPRSAMGSTFHKLSGDPHPANAWGPWDPSTFTVEDSAFGMVQMDNGATILLESSWALNTLQIGEAQTILCGTKAGADMLDGLRINGERLGKLYTFKPELRSGGAAFFESDSDDDPGLAEARNFVAAVKGEAQAVVKPEQAMVVTQILEAIYESAKTGQPVYFN